MRRWPLLAVAALAAAPATGQEAEPPPPPMAIPAEDLIAPPEITADEEAVTRVDPARRQRTPQEIAASRKSIKDLVDGARKEARVETAAKSAPFSRHARAWDANADHLSFLSDHQKSVVGQLAYAGAAVNLCDGVRLSADRVEAGFAELAATSGDPRSHERRLLVAYGVAVGLMMADHEANVPAFCAEAAALAGEPGAYLTAALR